MERYEEATMTSGSARPRVALVTCDEYPQLYQDEQGLIEALRAAGADAHAAVWSDRAVDWRGFDLVVLRSTWDYFQRIVEFEAWLQRIEDNGVHLCNPVSLVRWNMDKHY